jgi:hypothetical protein
MTETSQYLYRDASGRWHVTERWQWFELLAWAAYAKSSECEGMSFARVEPGCERILVDHTKPEVRP